MTTNSEPNIVLPTVIRPADLTKKHIAVELLQNADGSVRLTIISQSAVGDGFGIDGRTFRASNGVTLQSSYTPEYANVDALYVRGVQTGASDRAVIIPSDNIRRIVAAINEYNDYWATRPEPVIISDITFSNAPWMDYLTLPHGTRVQVMPNLSAGDILLQYKVTGQMARRSNQIFSIGHAIPRRGPNGYSLAKFNEYPLQDTGGQCSVRCFNFALLPDGTLLRFPWSIGEPLTGIGEIRRTVDLNAPQTTDLTFGNVTIFRTPEPRVVAPSGGEIYVNGPYAYYVGGALPDGRALLLTMGTTSPTQWEETINTNIIFEHDLKDTREGGRLTLSNVTGLIRLARYALPALINAGREVPVETGRIGDIIITADRRFYVITYSAPNPNSGAPREIRGVLQPGLREAKNYKWWESNYVNSMAFYTGMLVRIIPRGDIPPEAITLPVKETDDEKETTFDGFEIITRDVDEFEVKQIRAAFTQEIVNNFKAAGITRLDLYPPGKITVPHQNTVHFSVPTKSGGLQTVPIHVESVKIRTTGRPTFWNHWVVYPTDQQVRGVPIHICDANSEEIAAIYYPQEKSLHFGFLPFALGGSGGVAWLKSALLHVSRSVAKLSARYEAGEFSEAIDKYNTRRRLYDTFGIAELPPQSLILLNNCLYTVRPCEDKEQADITLLRGGKVKLKVIAETNSVAEKFITVVNRVGQGEDVIRMEAERRLREHARQRQSQLHEEIIAPTLAQIESRRAAILVEVAEAQKKLEELNTALRLNSGALTESVKQLSRGLAITEAIVQSVLPPGWKTRVDNGYIDACIDEAEYNDYRHKGLRIVAPFMLRVRIYYDDRDGLWKTLTYSESVNMLANRDATVFPHMTNTGANAKYMHLFPGKSEDEVVMLNWCYGAQAHTIKPPANTNIVEFLNQLKEYTTALNRLIHSAYAASGLWKGEMSYQYYIAMGIKTLNTPEEWMKMFGIAMDKLPSEVVSYGNEHKRLVREYLERKEKSRAAPLPPPQPAAQTAPTATPAAVSPQ